MATKRKPIGLICEAEYDCPKFRKWDSRDKENPGRMKTFRQLVHRWRWETENGDEFLNTVDWLPDTSPATKLADCVLPYTRGKIYKLILRGLKEEGGVLQANTSSITEVSD